MIACPSVAVAPVPKVPDCTEAAHERFKASTKAWRLAPLVGYQPGHPKTDLWEMRLCPICDSSLVRPVVIVSLRYVRMPRLAVPRLARGRGTAAASAGGLQ